MSPARSLRLAVLLVPVGCLTVAHAVGCASDNIPDSPLDAGNAVLMPSDAASPVVDAGAHPTDAASPCSPSGFCPVPFRADVPWTSISGTAADDVWIAGGGGYVEHWDGHDWKESKLVREVSPLDGTQNVINPETLYAISARSRNEVWAVGSCTAPYLSNGWVDGGATWHATEDNTGNPDICYSVVSSRRGGIWVSGYFGTARHSNGYSPDGGAMWIDVGGVDNYHYGLDLLATWLSPSDDLWLAGADGLLGRLPYGDGGLPSFFPDDPLAPASQNFNADTHADLTAIWGSDDTHVWAAGGAGTIVHLDVGVDGVPRFAVDPSPTTELLASMWGSSASDIWAVGAAGTIVHYDGKTWALEAARPEWGTLRAVWGSGPDDIWAVGDASVLLHKTTGSPDGGGK